MKFIFTALFFFTLVLSGCSIEKKKPEIVTTIYPFKSIIQEITGDRIKIKCILPAGADPHTYEILPSDFTAIQQSSAFFYGSPTIDGWASNVVVANKIELIKLVPPELLIDVKMNGDVNNYYLQIEDKELSVIDPHFWTDPVAVKAMIPFLLDELIKIEPNNSELLKHNADKFIIALTELDKKLKMETSNIKFKNVFTSHPFYNYFFKQYNFNVVGSIEIAPGYHSTPKDIKHLMELVKDFNVKAIFINIQHNNKPAKVLAESTGIQEYELDPIGGVQGRMMYEEIILYNFDIIKKALQ